MQVISVVEVTLEKVYHCKTAPLSVTGSFQFTMVNFTLVNFHDYGGKNKNDPLPMTIGFTRKKWVGMSLVYLNFVCLFNSLSLFFRKTV